MSENGCYVKLCPTRRPPPRPQPRPTAPTAFVLATAVRFRAATRCLTVTVRAARMTRSASGPHGRHMSDEPTLEGVRAIVTRIAHRGAADAGPDTPLTEGGLGLDSLSLLRTLLACEETFQVAFEPDTDFTDETLRTVGALFDLIRSKRAQ